MKLSADWLNTDASRAVFGLLHHAGFEALFVGGCVRNALLGHPVNDLDIATSARPDAVMELADRGGVRALPTGIDHGTVTLICEGQVFEVTSFREDIETDGRHAVVAYTDDIRADAMRRDFTMNALYCQQDGTIIDPLDGLPDLRAGRVRFILDPRARIMEDYLRILRFFRFTAWYGRCGIDPGGLAACAELADGLENVARERIGQEFLKLLAARDPAPAVASMEMSGVLARCLPGGSSGLLAPLVHMEQQHTIAPDPVRRLVAVGGQNPAEHLRLSKAQAKRAAKTAAAIAHNGTPAHLGYLFGETIARDALLVRAASVPSDLPAEDIAQIAFGAAQVCPITAADLMPDFAGKELGTALKLACQKWLSSDFELERDQLLAMFKRSQ